MTPYFLESLNGHTAQSQFRPGSPPTFSMVAGTPYRNALDEVRNISDHRTVEQTQIAYFWNLSTGTMTALGYWHSTATSFTRHANLREQDAAHAYAVMNAAAMDATIGCWEAKYHYLMLRPSMADKLITFPTLP